MTKHSNSAKQKKVDDYAKNPTNANGDEMMVDLQGELTESMLDEAIKTKGHAK